MSAYSEPVTFIIAIACLVFVIFRRWMAWSNDWRTFGLWSGSLLLSLGLLCRSTSIYAVLDGLSGVHNFTWFLGRMFFALAVYAFSASCLNVYPGRQRRLMWLTGALIFTILIIFIFFWRYIATEPEFFYSQPIIPADNAAFIISVALLSYAAGAMVIPAMVYYRLFKEEQVLTTKVRWFIIAASSANAVLLLVTRLLVSTLGYFFGLPAPLGHLADVFIGLIQFLVLGWLAAFLPAWVYTRLAQPVIYLHKLLAVWDVFSLKRACEDDLASVSPALAIPFTWRDYLWQPDLGLYQLVITLLDYRTYLTARPAPPKSGWQQELLELQPDYPGQVRAYRRLGRQLWQQQLLIALARTVSAVWHPLVMAPVALAVVFYVASSSLPQTLLWLGAVVLLAVLPILAWIGWQVHRGVYRDYDVSVREQRYGLVIVILLAGLGLVAGLNLLNAPRQGLICIYAGMVGLTLAGLLNRFTKISGHTFGNAYSAAIVWLMLPGAGLALAGTTLIVAWARVYLQRHTPFQALLGCAVGFLCVPLVFWLYLGWPG